MKEEIHKKKTKEKNVEIYPRMLNNTELSCRDEPLP